MLSAARQSLDARSRTLLLSIEGGLDQLVAGWLLSVIAACIVRIAFNPMPGLPMPATWVSYVLLAGAPIASLTLALRWFARPASGVAMADLDAAHYRDIGAAAAKRHPSYGANGLMVSLLIGLLLNILLRTAEYLVAMPALSGAMPAWLARLHFALTLDAVLFTSAYAVAFAAALRKSPLFPALLAAIWGADLAMQLGIAESVARQPDLPAAVGVALHRLLEGNVAKVLVSVGLWLPYLLLSTRVNVTYRHRLPR